MKALVLEKYGELVYKDVPDPVVGPEDLLVRVGACAICGSDVHGMDGSTGRRMPPVIMGHEAAGVVEDMGSGVDGFSKGDRVTFDSTIYCGRCRFCREGHVNLCDSRRVLGVSCDEYRQDGAFADYVVIPARTAVVLPDEVPLEHAALAEPISIAFHAARRAEVSLHDAAVVVGAGTIGLFIIQLLKRAGCRSIIAIDVDRRKCDLARSLGATAAFTAGDGSLVEGVRELTQGTGADVVFEAVGVAKAVETSIECLRKGGTLCLVGNLSPIVGLPLQKVVTRELSLLGSCASAGEYALCPDLIARGVVDVTPLLSAVAPLSEGAQWFARLRDSRETLAKVVLVP